MSTDVAPRAPSTPVNGRHLKRLSLSISPSTPLSASSSRTGTTPVSAGGPSSRAQGHGSRGLRLSMSGGGLGYTRSDPPNSAPPSTHDSPAHQFASITSPGLPDSPSPNPNSRRSGPSSFGPGSFSFPRSPSAVGASPSPSRGHARRMSSISYSSSREPEESRSTPASSHGTFPYSTPASPSPSPAFNSARSSRLHFGSLSESPQASPTTSSSPALDRFHPAPNGLRLDESLEEEDHDALRDGARRREGASANGFLSANRTGAGIGAQPTLTELNSDLLSFIATKERKCLDLREELKRHEEELQHLKKKWEGIVAKSLASSTPPTTTSLPRPAIAAEAKRMARESSSPSMTSHGGTPSPRPAPTHTLDLSLLSSTFDGTVFEPDTNVGPDIDLEIGESVQAAKAWMGGVFGKVMDAVSGIEEQLPPIPGTVIDGRLDVLQEEEEENETGTTLPEHTSSPQGASSAASASSTDENRRDSRESSQSRTSADSSSSFFGSLASTRPRSNSGGSGATVVPLASPSLFSLAAALTGVGELPTLPTKERPTPSPTPTPSLSSSVSTTPAGPLSPLLARSRPPQADAGHNRRRSTFDVLGAAAGGGWKSLSGRWAAVQESETFKQSKRATLGLVDSFERSLTETLGPLDPLNSFSALEPPPGSPPRRERESLLSSPLSSPLLSTTPPGSPSPLKSPSMNTGSSPRTSWTKAAPLSSAKRASSAPVPDDVPVTPRQGASKTSNSNDDWNWEAFLDGVAPTPSSSPLPPSPQHLGGYRRPSLMPARKPAKAPSLNMLDDDPLMNLTSPTLAPLSPAGAKVVAARRRPTSTSSAKSWSVVIGEVKEEDEGDEWGQW